MDIATDKKLLRNVLINLMNNALCAFVGGVGNLG